MKKLLVALPALAMAGVLGIVGAQSANAVTTNISNIATTGHYNMVSVSNDGSLVAASAEYDDVTIYNVQTQATRTIATPSSDAGVAVFSPDNNWLYVASYDPNAIYVYDLSDDSLDRTISLPIDAWNLAISPDGNSLYFATYSNSDLYKIELDNNDSISDPLDAGSNSVWQMCLSSDGATLYYPDYDNNMLDVVDTSAWNITDSWATGANPYTCSMDNDDNVYVGNYDDTTVTKFTPDGTALTGAQNSIDTIYGVATSCNALFVGDYNSNHIVVADPSTLDEPGHLYEVDTNDGGSGFYTYSGARNADGSVVAFGGYYDSDGLTVLTFPECASADSTGGLANTGASISNGLIGGVAMAIAGSATAFVVRRRRAANL